MFPFLCFSLLFPIPPSPFLPDGGLISPISSLPSPFSRAHARIHYNSVCKLPSLLHHWGRGVENQGNRGEGKVKGKSEDIELKSKAVNANQAVVRYFSVGGEGSEGKKREIIV